MKISIKLKKRLDRLRTNKDYYNEALTKGICPKCGKDFVIKMPVILHKNKCKYCGFNIKVW